MQYSLRTLMILMACVAVGCFVLFVLPRWAQNAVLALCFVLGPPAVLALLIYGNGYIRAFAIGCVLPLAWSWISYQTQMFNRELGFNIAVVTVASGFVSVGVRRYCVSKQAVNPSNTDA